MKKYRVLLACLILNQPLLSIASVKIPTIILSQHTVTLKSKVTDSNSTLITHQEIQKSGAQSVVQLLKTQPNLQVQDLGGDGSHVSINMRGFGDNASSNTLILLNGQPMINPDSSVFNLNNIPLSNIKQIEIIPSSASVIYGDQAVGGIINIITKQPQKMRQLSFSYGNYNSKHYAIDLSNHFKNGFGYHVHAGYKTTDNYRKHNKNKQANIDTLLNYQKNTIKSSLELIHTHQNINLPRYLTHQQVKQNLRQSNSIDQSIENSNIVLGSFQNNLNENWIFDVHGQARKMVGNGILYTPFRESRYALSITPELIGNIHNQLFPIIGLTTSRGQYRIQSNYAHMKTQTRSQQNKFAAFGLVTIPLNLTTTLDLGARHAIAKNNLNNITQSQKKTNQANIFSVSIHWHFHRYWQLFMKRAGNYRFPNADENAITRNNQPLKTQTGVSYEFGLRYQHQKLNAAAKLYRIDLQHEILFVPKTNPSETHYGSNQNLDPTQRLGGLLNIHYQVSRPLELSGSYNHVKAKFSSGPYQGNRLPFVPENTFQLASDYHWNTHWNWHFESIFTGDQYPGSDVANKSRKLGGHTILNSALSFKEKHLTITASINNITNKHYYAYALTLLQYQQYQTYYYPAFGRNAQVTISMQI